jgi:hypothetical protein
MRIISDISEDVLDMLEHAPPKAVLGLLKAAVTPIKLPGLVVKSAYREYQRLRWKLKRLKDWGEAGEPPKTTEPWSW